MATLVYSDVDGGERLLSLGDDPIMVGRAPECAIRSADPRVSRIHATFFFDQGSLWVEDMGSANGVYVGLERVQKAPVPTGEIVLVGSLVIRLLSASGTLPPPNGVHGTLAAWLESERKARVAVEAERDAFGQRVNELYDEARQLRDILTARGDEMASLRQELDQLKRTGGDSTLSPPTIADAAPSAPTADMEVSVEVSLEELDADSGSSTERLPLVEQVSAMRARAGSGQREALTAQIRAQGSERNDASLREAAAKAEAKAAELERRVGELEHQRAVLKAELVAQVEKTVALETRTGAESVDAALQTTEARAAKLAVELAEVKHQFETQRARVDELAGQLSDVETAAKAADAREKTAQAQLAEAHHQLQTASAANARQLKAAEAKVADFETRLRSFQGAEAELIAAQQTLENARVMVAGADQKIAGAVARAEESDNRAAAAETMAKAMAKDVAEALRRAAEVDMKSRGIARDLESAQRQAEEAEQREASSTANARQLEERAIAAEIQSTQLHRELLDKIAAVEAEVGERSNSALRGVEAEVERLQQELAIQHRMRDEDSGKRSVLEQQIATLEDRIRELESGASVAAPGPPAADESQQTIAALQSQLAAAKGAAKSAVRTAAALEKRVDASEAELSAANDARAALAAELANMRDQAATLGDESVRLRELEAQLAIAEQRIADATAHADSAELRSNEAAERLVEAERRSTELQAQLAELGAHQQAGDGSGNEHAERELAKAQAKIAELVREVDAAENVRQFAATTEREIAQLARDLREHKAMATQLTLERDRLAAQLADLHGDSVTMDRRASGTESSNQADLSRYTALVARTTELESKLARIEADNAALQRELAQAKARISAQDRDRDNEPTNIATVPTVELAECLIVLTESIDSLRANMRAASDETAVMERSDSVAAVSEAVSLAAEHIERARGALRILNTLFPTEE